ncbi:hypothetical protein EMPS_01703 [Entomortierella parvispora]|uniref:Autophagy-related protein 29 n=1 Tax=Entomortierella parvispora TaxID=205924 RepID=A0A9P3H3G8_9FUNG|nr:hypothetical protein EMPS_01703 [Entomortierella parvispora]
MDTLEQPIHIVIRLPYPRPEGFVDGQSMHWTESMEKTLWQLIGQTKPSLVDWTAVSRQLGNVPIPFLIKHAALLYQNQLQDLHRMGEQQDLATQHRPVSRSNSRVTGPGGFLGSVAPTSTASPPTVQQGAKEGNSGEYPGDKDKERERAAQQGHDGAAPKTQAGGSPLSGSTSTFPSSARPASMSSSASTIRPAQPSSPSPSFRTVASSQQTTHDTYGYNSGVLSNRGQTQPRSTRGSQLVSAPIERRSNNLFGMHHLPTSPQDEISLSEANRRISEPAHPFHHATISASQNLLSPPGVKKSPPGGRFGDQGNPSTFQDNDRSSSISSVSTPYSQSNSASQIFEETSFFNQLSSNDSIPRSQQQQRTDIREDNGARGAFQQPPFANAFGLGLVDGSHLSSSRYDQHESRDRVSTLTDDDGDTDDQEHDEDNTSPDESGPWSEEIKQLHLEENLAFLPIGSTAASGILPRSEEDGLQRRTTTSGEKMPFQLDDELANLGTRSLEEMSEHDGGDEDEDLSVRGIRFKDQPHHHHPHHQHSPARRVRGAGLNRDGDGATKATRTSPERSGPSSSKSSAQNSVGSSFSDLSDSSVTQSAMEDAYLSGFNNSKTSLFMHASTRN